MTAQDPHARARLLREAQAASALDHPNVATVHDVGGTGTASCSSRCRFTTVRRCGSASIRARPAPQRRRGAHPVAGEIASGLAAAHRAGIAHRDLKPAMFFVLTADGTGEDSRLRPGEGPLPRPSVTATRMTASRHRAVGTVCLHGARAGRRGSTSDARADVWALGVSALRDADGPPAVPGNKPRPPSLPGRPHRKRRHPFVNVRPDAVRSPWSASSNGRSKKIPRAGLDPADDYRRLRLRCWQLYLVRRCSRPGGVSGDASGDRRWWDRHRGGRPCWRPRCRACGSSDRTRGRGGRASRRCPQIDQLSEREHVARRHLCARAARHKQQIPNDPCWGKRDQIRWCRAGSGVQTYAACRGRRVYRAWSASPCDLVSGWARRRSRTWSCPRVFAVAGQKGGIRRAEARAWSFRTPTTLSDCAARPGAGGHGARSAAGESVRPRHRRPCIIFRRSRFLISGSSSRGHQSRIQAIRGCRRLPASGGLARTIHRGRADADVRPGDGAIPGRSRPARPGDVGARNFLGGHDDQPVGGVSDQAAAYAALGRQVPRRRSIIGVESPISASSGLVVPASKFHGKGPAPVELAVAPTRTACSNSPASSRSGAGKSSGDKRYIIGGAWDEPVYCSPPPTPCLRSRCAELRVSMHQGRSGPKTHDTVAGSCGPAETDCSRYTCQ